MRSLRTLDGEAGQLDLFVGAGRDIAARDAQDLMAWPFFSLAKTKRVQPIDFRMGEVAILVEATAEHGMATIWDADVLIWVASQIVEARDAGKATSRLIAATPHEILTFTRRGTGKAGYERLKAALDRLQSTSIATSIRQAGARRRRRFSWINEWRERKHGGKQKGGWSFDISHLHLKSGALSPLKRFAFEVRAIVRRQSLPGYNLALEHQFGRERLLFVAAPVDPFASARRRIGLPPVEKGA